MRACRNQSLLRHLGRQAEIAVLAALEHQRVIREHAAFGEARAEAVGHGAEILADHQAAVALAFECDDAEHVLEGVMHIGAFSGGDARRYPEHAHQAHHMVDAQRAGVFHVGAQDVDQGCVGDIAQTMGHEGRQAPVLAHQIDFVRRGAGMCAIGQDILPGPGFSAAGVGADRQILIQAGSHAIFLGACGDGRKLLVGQPLQPGMVGDGLGVLGGKGSDGG